MNLKEETGEVEKVVDTIHKEFKTGINRFISKENNKDILKRMKELATKHKVSFEYIKMVLKLDQQQKDGKKETD